MAAAVLVTTVTSTTAAVAPVARRFDIPVYVGAEDAGRDRRRRPRLHGRLRHRAVEQANVIEGERDARPAAWCSPSRPRDSRGSYTFAQIGEDEFLLVGDLLFQGSVGQTDARRDIDQLLNSVAALVAAFLRTPRCTAVTVRIRRSVVSSR